MAARNKAYDLPDATTKFQEATTYNNFYEFGVNKEDPARLAGTLKPRPWKVTVDGLAHKPTTFDVDDILKMAPLEERVYRLRCVEGWSMVIPWIGFPLAALLKRVEPTGAAKYVEFSTLVDPEQFPGQKKGLFNFGGARLAVHGGTASRRGAPPADPAHGGNVRPGAAEPERRADPRGDSRGSTASRAPSPSCASGSPPTSPRRRGTRRRPRSTASTRTSIPKVDHPRWSQATERRIGEFRRRKTLMFNGYDQVAGLYTGMDLKKQY